VCVCVCVCVCVIAYTPIGMRQIGKSIKGRA